MAHDGPGTSGAKGPSVMEELNALRKASQDHSAPPPEKKAVAPDRRAELKQRAIGVAIMTGVAVVGFFMFIAPEFKKNKAMTADKPQGLIETEKLLDELKTYDSRDLRDMQKRPERPAFVETGLPAVSPAKDDAPAPGALRHVPTGAGMNAKTDKNIIDRYREIDPAAAADPSASGGSSLRSVARPFAAGGAPMNKQGGVYIKGEGTQGTKGTLDIHNVSVKARLQLAIRSTAGNTVTAVSGDDLPGLPAGSICYGTASYGNKRAFVRFSKCRVSGTETAVAAVAVTGKDPGIPASVTSVKENANTALQTGFTGAAGQVADNLLSTASGGATSGVLNGATKEANQDAENRKVDAEYRVPANTSFNIYFE